MSLFEKILKPSGSEKFWQEMSLGDRRRLLESHNLWQGANTYFWQYLPKEIRDRVEEEYQKLVDKSRFE